MKLSQQTNHGTDKSGLDTFNIFNTLSVLPRVSRGFPLKKKAIDPHPAGDGGQWPGPLLLLVGVFRDVAPIG